MIDNPRMTRHILPLVAVVIAVSAWAQAPRVFEPRLDAPARLSQWTLDGSGTWEIKDETLVLAKAGTLGGAIRRPAALAIFNSPPLGRTTFEVEARSLEPVTLEVRDVNVIVGWQSPSRFYYVHLAAKVDAVHNGIFLVNDADRKRLDTPTSKPQLTDMNWHRVKVERDPASGRIAVFLDGAATPALEATDKTLTSGRVGVGSFDETGQFRNLVVTGYVN
jgi:hypothetical protein